MAINFDPRSLSYFKFSQEEKFFEAHEILEGLGRETAGEKREFYHGLIQLAASLVHFQKRNLKGAKELFRSASGYLRPYLPEYQGVDLSSMVGDFEKFLNLWPSIPINRNLQSLSLPR